MRNPFRSLFGILVALFVSTSAFAVDLPSSITWVNPTTDANGQALSVANGNALTKLQVFVSSAPITDTSTAAPFAELTVSGTAAASYTYTAAAGSTVYARIRACNANACSVFSNQGSKLVPFPPAAPNAPTGVQITITVTPPATGSIAEAPEGTLAIIGPEG